MRTWPVHFAAHTGKGRPGVNWPGMHLALGLPLHPARRCYILNHMVQYRPAQLDVSFAALSDATRRGVLEQLSRADASITDLAGKFHMTLTGMKKHVGVLERSEEHTSELQSRLHLVCRLLLEKKKKLHQEVFVAPSADRGQ